MEELLDRIDKEVKLNINLKSNNIISNNEHKGKSNRESLKLSLILKQVNESDYPTGRRIDIDEQKLREAFRII